MELRRILGVGEKQARSERWAFLSYVFTIHETVEVPDSHINRLLSSPILAPRIVRHFKMAEPICFSKEAERAHCARGPVCWEPPFPAAVPHPVDLPQGGQPGRSLWKVTQKTLQRNLFGNGLGACFITTSSLPVIPQVIDSF